MIGCPYADCIFSGNLTEVHNHRIDEHGEPKEHWEAPE